MVFFSQECCFVRPDPEFQSSWGECQFVKNVPLGFQNVPLGFLGLTFGGPGDLKEVKDEDLIED